MKHLCFYEYEKEQQRWNFQSRYGEYMRFLLMARVYHPRLNVKQKACSPVLNRLQNMI